MKVSCHLHPPLPFASGEMAPCTRWVGSLVRDNLEFWEDRIALSGSRTAYPRLSKPQPSHCADWRVLASKAGGAWSCSAYCHCR